MPATQENQRLLESQTFEFIERIPLVQNAWEGLHSYAGALPILFHTYSLIRELFHKFLVVSLPVRRYFSWPLSLLDYYVFQFLVFVKALVPYPFEVTYEELHNHVHERVGRVTSVVSEYREKAHDVYSTQVSHVKESAKTVYEQMGKAVESLQQNENMYIQKVGNTLISINENFTKTAQEWTHKASEDVADGEKRAQSLVDNLLSEVENLQSFAKSLPVEAQKRISPVVELVQNTYKELLKETGNSNLTIQERVNKTASYLRENTLPGLHKAIMESIKDAKENSQK